MPGEFQGKVVVITGGSRGIGREIAVDFAKAGAQTVIVSSSDANLAGGDQDHCRGRRAGAARDLRRPAHARSPANGCSPRVKELFGRYGLPVNCAGATKAGVFFELPYRIPARRFRAEVLWLRASQPAVLAAAEGCRRPCGQHRWRRGPLAVGGVSPLAARSTPRWPISPRACRNSATRDGVNVNVIHPGATETERNVTLMQQRAAPATGKSVDEQRAETLAKSGIRRVGTPDYIAELTLFLSPERARHIQGTAIAVDGGATVGYY